MPVRTHRRARTERSTTGAKSLIGLVATSVVAAPLALATAGAPVAQAVPPPPPSAVVDVNPNSTPTPLWGGRVEALSVDPVNPQRVYAASELGGVWRSSDGGASWSHVDAITMTKTYDVAVAPDDSSLIVVAGAYDGRQVSLGGVWISDNGGTSWAKAASSDPSCSTEPSATSVAIGPGAPGSIPIYVTDTCGLTYSLDSGSTWAHVDPAAGFSNGLTGFRGMDDVLVRPGTGSNLQVDVCGTQGFFRSNDSGATWSAPDPNSPTFRDADGAGPLGNAFGPCSLAVDPSNPNTVFLTNFSHATSSGFCQSQLLESNNAGAAGTWTAMGVTDAACADPFVQTRASNDGDPTHYDVYFGTSVRLLRQRCDRDNAPTDCLTGAVNWPRWDQNTPHTTPSNIAFDSSVPTGCPVLVSGDFGVMRPTSSGCGATPTLAMTNSGLHAFDSSQLSGTVAPGAMHLNFGTDHNGIYTSTDGGVTWTNRGPDVFNVLSDRTENPDASVLWRPCFGCGIVRSTPSLAADISWTNPPGADVANNFVATQFGPRSYAFVTPDAAAGPGVDQIWTTYVTTNAGANWTQFGSALPGDPAPGGGAEPGLHGAIQVSGTSTNPIFYLGLRVSGQQRIYRLAGPLDTSQPTNNATLTNVTSNLSNPALFRVDSDNPNVLYAVDTGAQRMMRSTNGGSSWIADNPLTSLVTNGGEFKFTSNALGPQVTGVGFDHFSDNALVGTRTNGLFASVNNGTSWIRVPGSEVIPHGLDFAFDNVRNQAYVGSRGRGVWRIELPRADLRISKSDSSDPVNTGEQLTYTITVTNDGPDTASDLTVRDTLPADIHYVTSSVPCTAAPSPAGDTVTCGIPNLSSGDSFSFTITVAVDADAVTNNGGPYSAVNTATVTSGETVELDPSDNTTTETTVINSGNDAPVAGDDLYNAVEDIPLVVPAPGVLGNDSDADGDVIKASLFAPPSHGSLALADNGSFTYTPDANYAGPDSFQYRATDGVLFSSPALVTIQVSGVDDRPSVSVIPGGTCRDDGHGGSLTIHLTDPDTPAGSLVLSATSSNTMLLPDSGISFSGAGSTRTVAIQPLTNHVGTSTVTIAVSDGAESATTEITVKVGGGANNTLNGTAGADLLVGDNGVFPFGRDTLTGNAGHDVLCGNPGGDKLVGGDGSDYLFGQAGRDALTGGNGADFFSGGDGHDTRTDFTPAQGDTSDGS